MKKNAVESVIMYYLAVFVPLLLMAYLAFAGLTVIFIICLGLYAFLYSPVIDYLRIRNRSGLQIKLIQCFNPFTRMKHFDVLFLKK